MQNVRIHTQITSFIRYLIKNHKSFYWILAFGLVALVLEYAATSLMIPLAPGNSARQSFVVKVWGNIATWLQLEPEFRTWLWMFMLLMCCRLTLGYLLNVSTAALGKKVHRQLGERVFSHVLKDEPMSAVYTRSVGHYISLAGDDTFKTGVIVASILQIFIGTLTTAVALIVLLQFSLAFFVGLLCFLVFSAVLVYFLVRTMIRTNLKATELSREAGTTFVESLNSLRSIRSLHAEQFSQNSYATLLFEYTRRLVEIEAIKQAIKALPAILLLLVAVVVLQPSSQLGLENATLFAATVIIIRVFASLGQVATAGSQLLTDIRAIRDIKMLTDLADSDSNIQIHKPGQAIESIQLVDVSFGYGDRGRVLNNLQFEFKAGHTYAIVGPSGAGKSTLADLLLGLSAVEEGEIQINEGQIPLRQARHNIMLVEQQPKIFSSSVRENLLMGDDANDAALLEALDTVNLKELIDSLPDGLSTRLAYLGENFSGGQRQRLGIARALVRNPDVLVLDEATSALDPKTREAVVTKLRAKMATGIVIFITHDSEIAALADDVLTVGGQG